MKMVIKEMDEQGRIVIPQEWRDEEGLKARAKFELVKDGKNITIRPLKYKSLAELKGIFKGKVDLKKMETAEMDAAVRYFERSRKR